MTCQNTEAQPKTEGYSRVSRVPSDRKGGPKSTYKYLQGIIYKR